MPPATAPGKFPVAVSSPPGPRFVDTHAHIHFDTFVGQVDKIIHRANESGVNKIITVGIDTADSKKAAEKAAIYENVWATVGIHPHNAAEAENGLGYIADLADRRKIVAIGECGLDYYRSKSAKDDQKKALRAQIEIALEKNLPVVFHVRDAFEDFFQIIKDYQGVRGVIHSFSGTRAEMEDSIDQGFYVALNGIMTFTKDAEQLEAARSLPMNRMLLETDCPFLSPVPYRGKTNEPSRITDIASFLSELRGEKLADIAKATSSNVSELFGI